MKTNDTSTRELAMEWWSTFSKGKQAKLIIKYLPIPSRPQVLSLGILTGREIEEIWVKEVVLKLTPSQVDFVEKPNRKQFKEFSPELFKAYIDKFSDEDKIKAMKMLYDEHQEFKKFDKVKVTKVGNNASDFHSNGLGIYKIADWKTTIFEIAGEYCPITFSHTPKCYGAYPLRLVGSIGTSAILGYVYNTAIQKI